MSKLDSTTYTNVAANTVDNAVLDADKIAAWYLDLKNVVNANSPEGQYAADAGSTDTYAVTLDPAPTAYAAGMVVRFKANTANTGACTLNVNSLGAKTIKKNTSDDMETGDIAADQIIVVCYDGTNFQFVGAATGEIATHKADFAKLQSASMGLDRQLAINGALQIWQRGTSFAVSTSGQYTADRWFARRSGAVTGLTVSRQTGDQARYCIRLQRDSGNTATNYAWLVQIVETANVIPLRGKELTFRFRARKGANYSQADSSIGALLVTGTDVDGTFTNSGGTLTGQSTIGSAQCVLTTSWQDFTVTTSAVASSANLVGIRFETRVGVNEFVGTAGTNDYVEIELIGVNVGDASQPIQHRHIADELALCQRYYQTFSGVAFRTAPSSVSVSTEIRIHQPLPGSMRTTPTVTITGTRGTDWALRSMSNATDTSGSMSSFASTPSTAGILFTGTAYTAGTGYTVALLTSSGSLNMDAEL